MPIEPLNLRTFDSLAVIASDGGAKLPGGRRRADTQPVAPTFTEEQLKAAERDAYQRGFLDGTAEGRRLQDSEQAACERQLMENLQQFTHRVAPLFRDYRELAAQAGVDLPKIALSIARKVASKALSENAPAEVEETAIRCVSLMMGEQKLTVTVHSSLAESLKKRLESLVSQSPDAAAIQVVGSDELPVADCRVEWKNGAMIRNTEQLWKEITQVIENMTAAATHHTENRMNVLQAALEAVSQAIPNETP